MRKYSIDSTLSVALLLTVCGCSGPTDPGNPASTDAEDWRRHAKDGGALAEGGSVDGGADSAMASDASPAPDSSTFSDAGSGDSGLGPLPCTQTLAPGVDVGSAISNAADGSTICLNDGNYGSVDLGGIRKSSYVTIRSTSGRGATISPQLGDAHFLRFTNLTISGSSITSCSSNVQILSSTFVNDGLLINMRGPSCTYPLNILIDGSSFINLPNATWEGRISVGDNDGPQPDMGLTISNNEIRGGCQSDGIQVVGGASGVQIGPANVFSDIVQDSSPVHCDSIQFYGSGQNNKVIGNFFHDDSVVLQHHPGPTGTTFKDNVVDNVDQFQIGESPYFVFEHNTIHNLIGYFGFNPTGTYPGVVFRNNIISGNSMAPNGLSGAAISYLLCETADQCSGTNQIIGVPTFVGGSSPSTWAGWQLAPSSLGYKNGSDGLDRGANYFGP